VEKVDGSRYGHDKHVVQRMMHVLQAGRFPDPFHAAPAPGACQARAVHCRRDSMNMEMI